MSAHSTIDTTESLLQFAKPIFGFALEPGTKPNGSGGFSPGDHAPAAAIVLVS
ncbi:hypothetical protein ACFQ88_25645 [Paenibacillus sp. NPDC056579]|uniref:hypothetical protein n=1 Tax=Paenibacillus sp. NPDC056579 TaxID=3345871 RepID=UPI0036A743F0